MFGKKKRKNNSAGYLLLEGLVSFSILMIAFTFFIGTMLTLQSNLKHQRNVVEANRFLMEKAQYKEMQTLVNNHRQINEQKFNVHYQEKSGKVGIEVSYEEKQVKSLVLFPKKIIFRE